MDETVGTIRQTLVETGLDKNTILAFVSDHGCHFKTRNSEYKRSPHDSSIHVPLMIEGPGFNRSMTIPEPVSHVDLAPTLLAAAGVGIPPSMQGHSFLPLLDRHTEGWRNEVYFEMTEFVTGRGLRTPQYTYAAAAPKQPAGSRCRRARNTWSTCSTISTPTRTSRSIWRAARRTPKFPDTSASGSSTASTRLAVSGRRLSRRPSRIRKGAHLPAGSRISTLKLIQSIMPSLYRACRPSGDLRSDGKNNFTLSAIMTWRRHSCQALLPAGSLDSSSTFFAEASRSAEMSLRRCRLSTRCDGFCEAILARFLSPRFSWLLSAAACDKGVSIMLHEA